MTVKRMKSEELMAKTVVKAVALCVAGMLALGSQPVRAADPVAEAVTIDTTYTVFTPQVRLRHPPHPAHASVILLTGGDGRLSLSDGTDPINPAGTVINSTGNFLIRSANKFLREGLNVMMADVEPFFPNVAGNTGIGLGQRMGATHASQLQNFVNTAAARWGKPVWVVGTSNGSISAVTAGGFAPALTGIKGLVLTSTRSVLNNATNQGLFDLYRTRITVPTLVLWNQDDACPVSPPAGSAALFAAIPASGKKSVALDGGHSVATDNCGAFSEHGYAGIEREAVEKIAHFIKQNP